MIINPRIWLFIKEVFEILGVLIIITGSVQALWYWILNLIDNTNIGAYKKFRQILGQSIIAGLEVFVAADVIATMLNADYYNIGIIFCLVILRILLSYFLQKELSSLA